MNVEIKTKAAQFPGIHKWDFRCSAALQWTIYL
jgi:hypothetical protein